MATIFYDDKDELDEIVMSNAFVHVERMGRSHWWMTFTRDGYTVTLNLTGRNRTTVDALIETDKINPPRGRTKK